MGAPAPVSTPEPAADPSGGESYDPAQDIAAGLEAFRAAKAAPAAEAKPSPEAVETAAVAAATGTPAAEPASSPPTAAEPAGDATDAKLNRVFNRIAALEKERDEARSSLSRLEARAARADELQAKLDELKASPTKVMEELGWTQETLADWVLKGGQSEAVALTAQDRKIAELEKRLKEREARDAEAQREARIAEYVRTIPEQLKDAKKDLPHVAAYYDSDAELASAVWGVMRRAYQDQKTELTVVEAAQAVERVLSEQAKRFSRASSQGAPAPTPASSTPAPAAKPPTPTLTNKATASAPPTAAETDDVNPNFKAAAELLRSFRKQ